MEQTLVARRITPHFVEIIASAERCADGTCVAKLSIDDLLVCGKILVGSDDQVNDQLVKITADVQICIEAA